MKRTFVRTNEGAFTLIELLIVIAIVAILAALLLPALVQGKRRGQSARCIGNLRQLGMAVHNIVTDQGAYPYDWRMPITEELNAMWRRTGLQFDSGVWLCPAANADLQPQSYGYNKYGVLKIGNLTNGLGLFRSLEMPVRDSDVVVPSDMMVGGDSLRPPGGFFRFDLSRARQERNDFSRHGDRANVLFCDQHQESPSVSFLLSDTNEVALVRWNRDHLPHRDRL